MSNDLSKERPILFSDLMVQALLEGKKTQTRRVIKPQPQKDGCLMRWGDIELSASAFENYAGARMAQCCPYGRPGDRLWVRETFGYHDSHDDVIFFKADSGSTLNPFVQVWKPSIFMPRSLSRILLEVVSVRVERLQEISEVDSMAEGIKEYIYGEEYGEPYISRGYGLERLALGAMPNTAAGGFQRLWARVNGQREGAAWKANPWVWAVEFKRVEGEG